MRLQRLIICPTVGILLALAAGCGKVDRFGAVSGSVSYKGKPIPAGTVTFHGPGGKIETAQIRPDGTYQMPKVLVGATKVTVETPRLSRLPPALAKAMREGDEATIAAAQRDGATIVRSVPIPETFKDPDKSGLSLDVHEGEQKFNIGIS